MSLDSKPDQRENKAERERLEAERWLNILENPAADISDIIKADFRLEDVLILSESADLREIYVERIFSLLEPLRGKEKLSAKEELLAIHLLLTAGEVLKESAGAGFVEKHGARLYHFRLASSAVVSGISHQKFTELLGKLAPEQKKTLLRQVGDILEASN